MNRWLITPAAWEARALALEVANANFEEGRLCLEGSCSSRSEIVFDLKDETQVGFCAGHAVEFAVEHADVVTGLPRRLAEEEVIHGPLCEGQSEADDR